MKFKKRRKSGRFRGSQTAHRGRKARTRGSGNQGGKGMAGTGKRGDQKKTLVIQMSGGNNYFGKDRTLRRGSIPKKLDVINLGDLNTNITAFLKNGRAKESKDGYEINLDGYKILGKGDLAFKAHILASAASNGVAEKVSEAGGSLKLIEKKKVEKKKQAPKKETAKDSK